MIYYRGRTIREGRGKDNQFVLSYTEPDTWKIHSLSYERDVEFLPALNALKYQIDQHDRLKVSKGPQ